MAAKQGSVSLFNDHAPSLVQKTLVEGQKYRFQKADDLDKCLAVNRDFTDTPRLVVAKCSIVGPMNILFTATPNKTNGYAALAIQGNHIFSDYCLESDSNNVTSLSQCDASDVSFNWKLKWDDRYGVPGTLYPIAASLEHTGGQCLDGDAEMVDCPGMNEMGKWIVTEAPEMDGSMLNVKLASIFSKGVLHWSVDCVKNSFPISIDEQARCGDEKSGSNQQPMSVHSDSDLKVVQSKVGGYKKFLSMYTSVNKYPFWNEHMSNSTSNFLARWFDDSYQLQAGKFGMTVPNRDFSHPRSALSDDIRTHVTTWSIGSGEFKGDNIPDWQQVKWTQFHLMRGQNGPSDQTRRMEANDDPNLETVNLGDSKLIDVLQNDIHIHNAPIEIVSVSASHGVANVTGDGLILYQAPNNFVGTAHITYTISDGLNGESHITDIDDTAVATVSINLPRNPKETNPDSDGSGKSIYLDRHTLNCGTSGIAQFQLKRNGSTEIYYDYECSPTASNDMSDWQNTNFSDNGQGSTIYLDRHAIDCNDKPIKAFKLKNNKQGNKVRYEYRCGSQTLHDMTEFSTQWDTASDKNHLLDRHNLECPTNQVLSSVKLSRDIDDGQMQYEYICGSPFEPDSSSSVKLQDQRSVMHKGIRASQRNRELACPAGYAITGYAGYGYHLMSSVKFRCHKIGTNGKWGEERWTSEYGGNNAGGGDMRKYSVMCSQDKYVTSIETRSSMAWVIDTDFECGGIALDINNKNRSYRYNPENHRVDMTGSPNGSSWAKDDTQGSVCKNNNVNQDGKYARVFTKANVGKKWRGNASAHVVNEIKYYCDQVKLQ